MKLQTSLTNEKHTPAGMVLFNQNPRVFKEISHSKSGFQEDNISFEIMENQVVRITL